MAKARSRIQKGREFQKKVKLLIQKAFKLGDDDIRTPVGAETGEDVKLSQRAREQVGLSIECKCVKSLNVWKSLEQAKANTPKGSVPALIFRRSVSGNRDVWIAVPLSHYLEVRTGGNDGNHRDSVGNNIEREPYSKWCPDQEDSSG